MRKLILVLAPSVAAAALMMAPAMASAATTEYGTGTSPFVPFTSATNVVSEKASGSGNFILENSKGEGISCSSLKDTGVYENVTKVGKSKDSLTYGGCVAVKGAGAGCEENTINPKTNHEITGKITDEVESETKVGIEIESGFNLKCDIAGTEEELGDVTSVKAVKGIATKGTDEVAFTKAANLKFSGVEVTITGTDATKTAVTKKEEEEGIKSKPVLIN